MSGRHLLLILAISLLWGLNFVAIAKAVEGLPPLFANAMRFGVVLLVLLPFLKRVEGQMPILFGIAFLMGVVHFGAVFLAMALAIDIAPIAIAAQTNVPFATLLAVLVLGERIGIWRTAGISLSFVGVSVMGLKPGAVDGQVSALALVLFSAFAYAVAAILMRRIRHATPMTVQAWTALAAVPGSLLLSLAIERGQLAALANAPWESLAGVAYAAVAASIIGHGGMYYLLQRYPVSTVTPYFLLAPVFAVLAAMLLLDERLEGADLLGGMLTLAGVLVITLRQKRREPLRLPTEEA